MTTIKKFVPHIGQRIIRSAVAVFICFVIYYLRGEQGIPFYSAIAAIQCIQPYIDKSAQVALNRTIGTFIGAFWGSVVLFINLSLGIQYCVWGALVMSFFIVVVLATAVKINHRPTAYFSCVVFLCITAVHGIDDSPFMFVLTRVTDTLIGIAVSLIVNVCHLPKKKRDNILFISALDDTLLKNDGTSFLPYSKIELNRLIAQGCNFTISTNRTPASSLEPLRDININLPIITINGAALYDTGMNKFVKVFKMDARTTHEVNSIFKLMDILPFVTVIVQDVLLIYFEDFSCMYMQDLFRKLRPSPYRNYIMSPLPEECESVYFYAIDSKNKIDELCEHLDRCSVSDKIRWRIYPSTQYTGQWCIKVYSIESGRQKMIDYIAKRRGIKKVVTFGTIKGEYDYEIVGSDYNKVVRKIRDLFLVSPWYKEE